jgi:hypothetical protein
MKEPRALHLVMHADGLRLSRALQMLHYCLLWSMSLYFPQERQKC